jgi:hypothetical protein
MTSPLIYVHTDVPPGMTLVEWRRARRAQSVRRPTLRQRVRKLLPGAHC